MFRFPGKRADPDPVRPRYGHVVHGDGTTEPVVFRTTDDPTTFQPVMAAGEAPLVLGPGDQLSIDVIGPGQGIILDSLPPPSEGATGWFNWPGGGARGQARE